MWPFSLFRKKPAPPKVQQRFNGFSAADYSRVTSSLLSESDHIMRILRYQGKALRARSRQLANNNCYAAKFLNMAQSNICGPTPFRLQAKIKSSRGKLDSFANANIETEWTEWGRPGQCDITGRWSWADLQRMAVRTLVTDGEVLLRVFEGSDFGPWGLQLQLLDTDRLDEDKNEELAGGGAIVAGVELNGNGKTVAYWFLKSPPKTWQHGILRDHVRIPADQIIHLFMPMYAEQVRGVPWMYSAIIKLHQLGAFEEAAIIAARVGASKMGFFKNTGEGATNFVPAGSDVDSAGNFVQSAEPGEFGQLPAGWEFQSFDPAYPDAQVEPFMKSCLRGVASGLNVASHSLMSDHSDINYSSARSALLEERDNWMLVQEWLIEHLHIPLYRRWIRMAGLTGRLNLQGPPQKYYQVNWSPKRWQWVDPKKDIEANILAINKGLKSRTEVICETGGDIEDVFAQLQSEQELAEEYGVEINADIKKNEPAEKTAPDKEEAKDESDEDTE